MFNSQRESILYNFSNIVMESGKAPNFQIMNPEGVSPRKW